MATNPVAGVDNAALGSRMSALDTYTQNYLRMLDAAGVKYTIMRQQTPGSADTGQIPFHDYVVKYTDFPEYPGTLMGYHANMGTDPKQLLSSSVSNASSARGLSQTAPQQYAQSYAPASPSAYDTSYTYNATRNPQTGTLSGMLNPNRITPQMVAAGGYTVPPSTFSVAAPQIARGETLARPTGGVAGGGGGGVPAVPPMAPSVAPFSVTPIAPSAAPAQARPFTPYGGQMAAAMARRKNYRNW